MLPAAWNSKQCPEKYSVTERAHSKYVMKNELRNW